MAEGYRGTSHEQDNRFKDKTAKLLRTMNFDASFDKKVDMRKVELSVMKPWIAQKISTLLGFEDEVVIEYVNGLLEDEAQPIIDAKKMQISLTGFLEKKTSEFMVELWRLLLSAQESPVKVPAEFIEQKKEEMRKRKEEQELAVTRRGKEVEQVSALDEIRNRERAERSERGRGRGRGRGGFRGGFERPAERDNGYRNRRPPSPRRRSPSPRRSRNRSTSSSRSQSPPQRKRPRSRSSNRRRSSRRSVSRDRRSPSRSRSRSRDRSRRDRSRSRDRRDRSRSRDRDHSRRKRRQSSSPPPKERRERKDSPPRGRDRSVTPVGRAESNTPPPEVAREGELKEKILKEKVRSRRD